MSRGKKIASVILTLVFLIGMLFGAAYITHEKSGLSKSKAFYDNPKDYDVYIFGSSHATMGILPLEMWKAEGITSYNFSNYGQALPVDYWLLRTSVAEHKPKVVVIDVFTVFFTEKYSHEHLGSLHQSLDPIPASKLKYEALGDLLDDGENKFQMYFPFSLYHSRWDSLNADDFKMIKTNPNLGADVNQLEASKINGISDDAANSLFTRVSPFNVLDISETDDTMTVAREYLIKMIEFCQGENIPVVLVNLPGRIFDYQVMYINSIYELADTYNVPFIDGMRMNVVNYETDMFDSAHLNSSGAHKWSYYLASLLKNSYELEDHSGDKHYAYIEDYYTKNVSKELDYLTEDYSLYGCLMLASNPEYKVDISINSGSSVFDDDQVLKFIKNIMSSHDSKFDLDKLDAMWESRDDMFISTDESNKDFHLYDTDITILIYNSTLDRTVKCQFNVSESDLDGFLRVN